ncbi:MAG: AAA-associated domain-containing protein [Conexivisphaerales archaeon]
MSSNLMHPSTRVADLLGLLIILENEFEGKTDLYELSDKLGVELDDFMPIVYTANELGFVVIGAGDIVITDKGLDFLSSTLKKRKEIIKASLVKIEPFKSSKELKQFSIEELNYKLINRGIMDYNSSEGLHQLEVLLNEWGIYSGFLKRNEHYMVVE